MSKHPEISQETLNVDAQAAALLREGQRPKVRDMLRRAIEAWNDGRGNYARLLLGKARAAIAKAEVVL